MKLLFVIGTRPEAIKLAPVVLEARRRAADGVQVVLVVTGQHRELLAAPLKLFGIEPDISLDLMQPDQQLADFAARALTNLSETIARVRPDAVVVQGDTTSAMMGALAAFYQRVPVAHVEAGLRTNDLDSPFPEELNRRVVGQIARWHLAPTRSAAENLRCESLPPAMMKDARVVVTGNTVIDALFAAVELVKKNQPSSELVARARAWKSAQANRRLIIITGHRRENFGAPFEEFCNGLLNVARAHPEALLVYPVHLNPNVQRPVRAILDGHANVLLTDAADYPDFVALMSQADLIVTDSGGVQEEAPALGIPVLVTRTTTERPEAVATGHVRLVGPDRAKLFAEADAILRANPPRTGPTPQASPYGDGKAAARCVAAILGEAVTEFIERS